MSEQSHCIGYLRIAPIDQYPGVQAEGLKQTRCTEIYGTAVLANSPEALKKLLDLLDEGDTLFIDRLDRLSGDEYVMNLQQPLQAMSVTLITASEQETNGDDDAE